MSSSRRVISRSILAGLFILAGILHFVVPDVYMKIMPPYLTHHLELVYVSGVFEILGGLGLLLPSTRKWAGWGLIALLLAVFPANVQMFQNHLQEHGWAPLTIVWLLRLPVQLPLIWWTWKASR